MRVRAPRARGGADARRCGSPSISSASTRAGRRLASAAARGRPRYSARSCRGVAHAFGPGRLSRTRRSSPCSRSTASRRVVRDRIVDALVARGASRRRRAATRARVGDRPRATSPGIVGAACRAPLDTELGRAQGDRDATGGRSASCGTTRSTARRSAATTSCCPATSWPTPRAHRARARRAGALRQRRGRRREPARRAAGAASPPPAPRSPAARWRRGPTRARERRARWRSSHDARRAARSPALSLRNCVGATGFRRASLLRARRRPAANAEIVAVAVGEDGVGHDAGRARDAARPRDQGGGARAIRPRLRRGGLATTTSVTSYAPRAYRRPSYITCARPVRRAAGRSCATRRRRRCGGCRGARSRRRAWSAIRAAAREPRRAGTSD